MLEPPYERPTSPIERTPHLVAGRFGGAAIVGGSGAIASEGYVAGTSGWSIDGDGNVEFNEGTFRGDLVAGGIYIPGTTGERWEFTDTDVFTTSLTVFSASGDYFGPVYYSDEAFEQDPGGIAFTSGTFAGSPFSEMFVGPPNPDAGAQTRPGLYFTSGNPGGSNPQVNGHVFVQDLILRSFEPASGGTSVPSGYLHDTMQLALYGELWLAGTTDWIGTAAINGCSITFGRVPGKTFIRGDTDGNNLKFNVSVDGVDSIEAMVLDETDVYLPKVYDATGSGGRELRISSSGRLYAIP